MRIGLRNAFRRKTYILSQIDFIKILAGSTMLRELCPDYDSLDNDGKNVVRRQLADSLIC